jgi:hypothetical protein
MNIQTLNSKQTWKSPDGQRVLHEVMFTSDDPQLAGRQIKALSYSTAIATPGFSGAADTYKKTSKQGQEQTYLRQPPREQAPMTPAIQGASTFSREPHTRSMYDSYAKDLVVALIEGPGYTRKAFDDAIQAVAAGGDHLFSNATLGIALAHDVDTSLNTQGRVEAVFGHTEKVTVPDPFNTAESL